MSKGILNKASLVMVPEAPIDGTMPSVFPEDRSGDFTFTRGSNLAATRVASNGLIEKGRENLLLQSNQFDTTWVNYLTAETSGQSGYDGSSDAWLLTKTGANGNIYQNKSSSGVQTISVYAKKNTNSWLQIYGVGSPNVRAYYDLENGVLGGYVLNAIERKIEDVGNGWYRCSVTFNSSLNSVRLYPSDGNNDESGTSGSIYIQDAQLESSMVATSYIESGATTGKAGLLENEPRIDFTGGGCGSLLLEPQRTNIITSSEYLGTGFEIGSSTSIDYNDIASPDGYKSASKVTFGAQGIQDYFRFQFTNTANTTYVGSIFLKRGSFDEINVRVSGNAVGMDGQAIFNLANGTFRSELGSVTPKMEDYGNGWYRCSVGDGTNATIASPSFRVSNQGLEPGFVYAWGAQLEAASYPTSYIPTHGNIVTRSGDVCNGAGDASTFNSAEGVLYAEVAALANDGTNRRIVISDGSYNNNVQIYYYAASNRIRTLVNSGGIVSFDSNYTLSDVTEYHKFAVRYKQNDFSLWVDGVEVGTDTSGNTPSVLNQLNFNDGGGSNFYGKTKQVLYFPTALTDEECSALTQP